MVFDASLNVIAVDVDQPEGENFLTVKMDVGMPLPFAAPGTQTPMVVPIGQLHFRIDKQTGMRWGEQIKTKAEELSSTSPIQVASSLSEVEEAANALEGMRGNGR